MKMSLKTKEQLEKEIELWEGLNKYIVRKNKALLKELESDSAWTPELKKKWTEKELFDLNKAEQVKMLKELGQEIPRYEKDRVKLLMELLD
jgi:hypothetical protein